jgi:hypothetical protein
MSDYAAEHRGQVTVPWLVRFGVFRVGLLEDRNVGVGVIPECEEISVGRLRLALLSSAGTYARCRNNSPLRPRVNSGCRCAESVRRTVGHRGAVPGGRKS